MEYIAGIDIGGTSIKVVVCDRMKKIVSFEKSSTLSAYRTQKGSIADTGPQRNFNGEILWEITKKTIYKAVRRLPKNSFVYSIAVSSCGCTLLLLDGNGRQINLKTDDKMRLDEVNAYKKQYTYEDFQSYTGYPLEADNSGIHLSAFCRTGQKSKIAHVLSVDDYILWKLCGETVRNYSTAASCGMWDWQKNKWLSYFLEQSGLDEEAMGCPVESGIAVGNVQKRVAEDTGLSHKTVACTGGHDYECAAFACHSELENNIFNVTGTVDLIAVFSKGDLIGRIQGCRHISDKHVIPDFHSDMMETIGAAQTEWLKKQIIARKEYGFSLDWESCFKDVEKLYNEHPVSTELFIPKVFGTCVPEINHHIYGVFCGLQEQTDSGALLRAMIEGMAFQNLKMLGWLNRERDEHTKIVAVGGAGKSPVWMQIKADILNIDILSPEITEASALGAAMLGGTGSGIFRDYEEAWRISDSTKIRMVHPDRERTEYYQEIYRKVFLPLEQRMEALDKIRTKINRAYRRM